MGKFYILLMLFTCLLLFLPGCTGKDIKTAISTGTETAVVTQQPLPTGIPAVLWISCDTQVQPASPFAFSFSLPMVSTEEIGGAVIDPDKLQIDISPGVAGQYIWRSESALDFIPAQPLPWGSAFTVQIRHAVPLAGAEYALDRMWEKVVQVQFLTIAGKTASWPVVPGYPRFIQPLTSYTEAAGAGPVLLLYDQPVAAEKIAAHCKAFNDHGMELTVKIVKPQSLEYLLDSASIPAEILGVSIADLPEEGGAFFITVPQWLPEQETGSSHAGDPGAGLNMVQIDLVVNKTFAVTRITPEQAETGDTLLSLKTNIKLFFNNKFSFTHLKKLFRISPAPLNLYTYLDWDGAFTADVELAPGTKYKLAFTKQPRDVLGNPLDFRGYLFRSRDLPPVLEAPLYPLVLEKNRGVFPIKVRNLKKTEARIYTFAGADGFAAALKSTDQPSAAAYNLSGRYRSVKIDSSTLAPNADATFEVKYGADPGLKCIEVRGEGTGSEAAGEITDTVLIQTTDLGITAKVLDKKILAWVTTLSGAAPVPSAQVVLYDDEGKQLAKGVTDKDGVVLLEAGGLALAAGVREPVVLIAKNQTDTAVSRLVNEEMSSAWQFGLAGAVEEGAPLRAALFTERGVYRPGEKVYFKLLVSPGTARAKDNIRLQIHDPRGKQLVDTQLALDEYTTAAYEWQLEEDARVGEYAVQAEKGTEKCLHKFRVEEYRVPTFVVKLTAGEVEWKTGEAAHFLVDAEYMHGGKLAGREVTWSVFRQFESFTAPAYPDYRFSLEIPVALNDYTAREEARLNGQGQLPAQFTAGRLPVSAPVRYLVEAAVTDVDRQTYAGKFNRLVHSSEFYLGVVPPARAVLEAGTDCRVPVLAVKQDGTLAAGVRVTAILERTDYHTTGRMTQSGLVQLFNRSVPVKVAEFPLVTGRTAVDCSFRLPAAGLYRLRLTATDSGRNPVETGFLVTVSGGETTAWPRFDKDQIELTLDKTVYKPGDTAQIVVQTPFAAARGLLTVEQGSILHYRTFTINNNTPALPLEIKGSYAPNVFVSVILLRGRMHDEQDASGFETGAPGFRIGYSKLRVELKEQALTVKAQPGVAYAAPGDMVKINLELQDHQGKPAPGQVTLMVVDEAVLSLTRHITPNPLRGLYSDYPLGVRTGTLYLDLPHARRSRLEKMFTGGGGGDEDDLDITFPLSLRKLFLSTVYWNPGLQTGKNGKISVDVRLPDNTTTYRIMAVAVDMAGRAGAGEDKVISRKPLMIQPGLPRFIYPGDEFQVEANVFNGSTAAGDIKVQVEFEGLAPVKAVKEQVKRADSGAVAAFAYRVKALPGRKAVVRFTAAMRQYTDAAEYTLPVLEPGTKRVVTEKKEVISDGTITLAVPAERVPGTLQLELTASATALSELKDSVQYLMQYPNGCIEQTTSTAYPLLVLSDLLPQIGVEVDKAQLKEFADAGIKRILSFQTAAGGLAYWPGGTEPHAFATAFGLTALIEAKKQGYDLPAAALQKMGDFLEATLRQGEIREDIPHGSMADGDTRALFVMTLGRLGRPQPGYISTLWREKSKLTAFGLSFLALAAEELGGEQPLLPEILAEIRRLAREESAEAYFTGDPKGGWSFDSPLRTHAASLIAYADQQADKSMGAKLLKGLLNRQKGGLWGNTQENVFGIMGVHKMAALQRGGSLPGLTLKVNQQSYGLKDMEELSRNIYSLTLGEKALTGKQLVCTLAHNQAGLVYFTARLAYEAPLTKNDMAAIDNGFSIKRTYRSLAGQSLEGKPLALGSLVQVHLEIKTDQDLHYCVIDDKLPAGLEPLNVNLASTESAPLGGLTAARQRSLSVLSYNEIRDHRAAFYVDEMLAGEYEFTYRVRVITPGQFLRPAGRGEAMYQPAIYGTTGADYIVVQ